MSTIFSSLDSCIKKDLQILQLAGNTKLENMLELVLTKLRGGYSEDVHTNGKIEKQK